MKPIRSHDRAVSPQLGAILLLAVIAIALASYQVTVVPQQTKQTEVQHVDAVRDQMVELDTAIAQARSSGESTAASVDLGPSYADSFVFVKPAPPSGRLTTIDGGAVTIQNAKALENETADYWNGSSHQFSTRHLQYTIDYARYQSPPTVRIESSIVAADYQSDQVVDAGGSIIEGRRISLTTLTGDVGRSGQETEQFIARPVSTGGSAVSLRNTSAPIRLRIPTRLGEDVWRDTLSDQLTSNGGHVQSIGYSERSGRPNLVTITLEKGITYEFQVSRVGLGSVDGQVSPRYLTITDRGDRTVAYNDSTTVTVQVRDRFDNPVSGVALCASVEGGPGRAVLPSNRSQTDGTVEVVYQAPDSGGEPKTARINISAKGASEATATVEREIRVTPSGGGGDSIDVTLNTTEPGVRCPTEDRCEVDAGKHPTLPLRTSTDPAIPGARVDYSSNNRDSVIPGLNSDLRTNDEGVHTTTAAIINEGTATLEANVRKDNFNGSDTLTIEVFNETGCDPCVKSFDVDGGYIERATDSTGGGSSTYITWATEVNYSIIDPRSDIDFERVEITAQEYFDDPDTSRKWYSILEYETGIDNERTRYTMNGTERFTEIHFDCTNIPVTPSDSRRCLDRSDTVEEWRYVVEVYGRVRGGPERLMARQIYYVNYSVIEGGPSSVSTDSPLADD